MIWLSWKLQLSQARGVRAKQYRGEWRPMDAKRVYGLMQFIHIAT